jgi:hypothetical protein
LAEERNKLFSVSNCFFQLLWCLFRPDLIDLHNYKVLGSYSYEAGILSYKILTKKKLKGKESEFMEDSADVT